LKGAGKKGIKGRKKKKKRGGGEKGRGENWGG